MTGSSDSSSCCDSLHLKTQQRLDWFFASLYSDLRCLANVFIPVHGLFCIKYSFTCLHFAEKQLLFPSPPPPPPPHGTCGGKTISILINSSIVFRLLKQIAWIKYLIIVCFITFWFFSEILRFNLTLVLLTTQKKIKFKFIHFVCI